MPPHPAKKYYRKKYIGKCMFFCFANFKNFDEKFPKEMLCIFVRDLKK